MWMVIFTIIIWKKVKNLTPVPTTTTTMLVLTHIMPAALRPTLKKMRSNILHNARLYSSDALSSLQITDKMSPFHFTHAIVCGGVPSSYSKKAVGLKVEADLEKAKKQHLEYVNILREVGLKVIEILPDENHPDCVYVEDTAVVRNGIALISKPGHPTREKEVERMRSILKNELNLQVVEIEDPEATLDGGDVLFTGKEFLVGVSGRTNQAGVSALASTFPEFPCTPIKVDTGLHLKCSVTMVGPDVMSVGPSPEAREILERIKRNAKFQYKTLELKEYEAANAVFFNGTLIHRSGEECPESAKIFEEQLSQLKLKPINFSEFSKSDGSLTCCSILICKDEKTEKS